MEAPPHLATPLMRSRWSANSVSSGAWYSGESGVLATVPEPTLDVVGVYSPGVASRCSSRRWPGPISAQPTRCTIRGWLRVTGVAPTQATTTTDMAKTQKPSHPVSPRVPYMWLRLESSPVLNTSVRWITMNTRSQTSTRKGSDRAAWMLRTFVSRLKRVDRAGTCRGQSRVRGGADACRLSAFGRSGDLFIGHRPPGAPHRRWMVSTPLFRGTSAPWPLPCQLHASSPALRWVQSIRR